MITENTTISGKPNFIATRGVKALDVENRDLWEQKTSPFGNSWAIVRKNAVLDTDYVLEGDSKYVTSTQKIALTNSNSPSAENPFATVEDIQGIRVKTAAEWALDTTVYSNKSILVSSDVFYGATDQRQFKLADGVQAWSALDYMPIGAGSAALAAVLTVGNITGGTDLEVSAGDKLIVDDTTASRVAGIGASKEVVSLDIATYPSLTELSYVKGATSNLQTQITAKEPSFSTLPISKGGTNSGTALNNNRILISSAGAIVESTAITASRVLVSNGSGIPIGADTSTYPDLTELSYVKGVTSGIQAQLDAKVSSRVLQIINATYSTSTSSTSSTPQDSGLTASITPSSSSSTILVLVSVNGCYKQTNNTALALRLLRGSTTILTFEGNAAYTNSTAISGVGSASCSYLDSPATTSATVYKVQLASTANNTTVFINSFNVGFVTTSTITLIEYL